MLPNFNLLGYLDKDGERTAFLGLGDEIFIVKEGDSFGNEYLVSEITEELLIVMREDDIRQIKILLEKPNQ